MEHITYEALVEEGLTRRRRTRQDQVWLMTALKTCEDDGCLDRYCDDINLSPAAAKNYLAAHAKFLDLGLVPGSGDGVDAIVAEMWEEVFDPTLDGRFGYGAVDREGVDAAADELGLKGPTKAYDIAKNPQSMKAAIIGDERCATAAADAVIIRMEHDPKILKRVEDEIVRRWRAEPRDHGRLEMVRDDDFFQRLFDKAKNAVRTTHDLEDLPEHLLGYAHGRALEIQRINNETVVVLEARRSLNAFNQPEEG